MYQIYENDVPVGTTASVTHIKYNTNNGCYNLCGEAEAEGFVCVLPKEVETTKDDGTTETVTMNVDCVFALPGKTMKGHEPVGRYTEVINA